MADEEKKPEEKKSFLQLTWQQVVSAVIVALFLGIFWWIGGTLKGALTDIEDLKSWKIETQTLMNNNLANTLEGLDEAIKGGNILLIDSITHFWQELMKDGTV